MTSMYIKDANKANSCTVSRNCSQNSSQNHSSAPFAISPSSFEHTLLSFLNELTPTNNEMMPTNNEIKSPENISKALNITLNKNKMDLFFKNTVSDIVKILRHTKHSLKCSFHIDVIFYLIQRRVQQAVPIDVKFSEAKAASEICGWERYRATSSFMTSYAVEIFKCFVNPTIALVGFILNILCMVVLREDGLTKPSNSLLLGVVIAASFYQISAINVLEVVQFMSGDMYKYEDHSCFIQMHPSLLICKYIFYYFENWGKCIYAPMYSLITVERLLAVFMPLKLRTVVTSKNVLISTGLVYFLWLPWVSIKTYSLYQMERVSMGSLTLLDHVSPLLSLLPNLPKLMFTEMVCNIVTRTLPVIFVFLGNVAIALKIHWALRTRCDLTMDRSNCRWSRQTSKVLLTTCLVFSSAHIVFIVVGTLLNYYLNASYTDAAMTLELDCIVLSNLLVTSNLFFILISTNKKLYGHFLRIMQRMYPRRLCATR
ncbi:G-protein coupled receptor [Biomphalaria glabrata]|nr:putative G-protein coupled receptor [Biomphalaria glabrata]KAI8774319.1 G-protein coupled receptor [Biomphalaria glabrata]